MNEHNFVDANEIKARAARRKAQLNEYERRQAQDRREAKRVKTRLVAKPHLVIQNQTVIEVWYGAQFIGTVNGADGPGVRFTSKYPVTVNSGPHVTEIRIEPEKIT